MGKYLLNKTMYWINSFPELKPHLSNAHDYFENHALDHAHNLGIDRATVPKIHNGQNEIWCGNLYLGINSSIECLKIL